MSSPSSNEVAGALPPPSGPPLSNELAPPAPVADPVVADPAVPDSLADDSLLAAEPVRPRRVNPDVIVPVGVWPEGTWDPEPVPEPLTDAAATETVTAASPGPSDDAEPSLFAPEEALPSERVAAERAAPTVGTAAASAASAAAIAGSTTTGASPTKARRTGGLLARQPRWAKFGGGAAVLFAAAAAVSVYANKGNDDTSSVATAAASATSASPTPSTLAPATTAPATTLPATTLQATTLPATTLPATTLPPTTATATTAPAPTTAPGTSGTDVLAAVPVAAERTSGFAVTQFPVEPATSPDGCDVRTLVLRRDSLTPVQTAPDDGCRIVAGSWVSAYDGAATDDPASLTLDRTVSLREVWRSGASTWTPGQRAAFLADVADRRTVRLASAASVRAKGDRDLTGWLPDGAERCTYLADYLGVKGRWGLSMDRAEADRARSLLNGECAGVTVAPWSPPPPPVEFSTPTTVPYYLDCADAARRGVSNIPRGAPGYRDALDGNGNGIACE